MVVLNNNYTRAQSLEAKAPQNQGYPVTLYLYAKKHPHATQEDEYESERFLKKQIALPFPPFPGLWIDYENPTSDGNDPWRAKMKDISFNPETGEVECDLGEVFLPDYLFLLGDGWTQCYPEASAPEPSLKRTCSATAIIYAKDPNGRPGDDLREERFLEKKVQVQLPALPKGAKLSEVYLHPKTGGVVFDFGQVKASRFEELLTDGWTQTHPQESTLEPTKRKPRKRLQARAGQRNGNEIKQIVQG